MVLSFPISEKVMFGGFIISYGKVDRSILHSPKRDTITLSTWRTSLMLFHDDESLDSDHSSLDDDRARQDDGKPVREIYRDRVRQWLNETKEVGNKNLINQIFSTRRNDCVSCVTSEIPCGDKNLLNDSSRGSGCFVFLPFYKTKRRNNFNILRGTM